jgi:hypothetical protein
MWVVGGVRCGLLLTSQLDLGWPGGVVLASSSFSTPTGACMARFFKRWVKALLDSLLPERVVSTLPECRFSNALGGPPSENSNPDFLMDGAAS